MPNQDETDAGGRRGVPLARLDPCVYVGPPAAVVGRVTRPVVVIGMAATARRDHLDGELPGRVARRHRPQAADDAVQWTADEFGLDVGHRASQGARAPAA